MADFGNTTIEASTGQLSGNILGSAFTSGAAGSIASISAYLAPSGSTRVATFAIYNADTDALLGQTEQITLSAGTGWYTANFTTPVAVSASTSYRLLAWADGSFAVTIARASQTSVGRFRSLSYTGTFPDPSGTTTNNFRYSIYATYAPESTRFFSDGFESGDTSAFSFTEPTVTVGTTQALHGTYGAQVNPNNGSQYVEEEWDGAKDEVYCRWYINTNTWSVGSNFFAHMLFNSTDGEWAASVNLIQSSGSYFVGVSYLEDSFDETVSDDLPLPGGAGLHCFELHLKRATTTSSNDGEVQLWIDGDSLYHVTGIDNHAMGPHSINIGTMYKEGTHSGNIRFDSIELDSASYIGPIEADSTNGFKVWDGSSFSVKPVKWYNGSSFVAKPLKRWDGSSWVEVEY